LEAETTDNNTIQNNLIGTSADGTANIGNDGDGIFIQSGGDGNQILDNVIVGSAVVGVEIDGNSTGNVIQGNRIGTDASGNQNWGSGENGILLENGATSNTIGGVGAGEGNIIAFSGQSTSDANAGILVETGGTANSIRGNSIYANDGPAVDLSATTTSDGIDLNDAGDTDGGGNNKQNWAGLTSVTIADDGTFAYELDTTTLAAGTYTVDFYASTDRDGGRVEGERYLGTITGVASGDSSLTGTLSSIALASGEFVTLVTTDASGNSSEFSTYAMAMDGDSDGISPEGIKATSTNDGGLSINDDGGNDIYLIADNSDALLGGLTSLSFETQFATRYVMVRDIPSVLPGMVQLVTGRSMRMALRLTAPRKAVVPCWLIIKQSKAVVCFCLVRSRTA